MTRPILMTKVENALKKKRANVDFQLQNVYINGVKRGCSGFIINTDTNTVVYINTEPHMGNYMYRYADDTKDFTGYHNRWAHTFEELIDAVDVLLNSSPEEKNDSRV